LKREMNLRNAPTKVLTKVEICGKLWRNVV
jgi:hypothetical protein